jgi:CPA1 family monovalent cation:H+ antiporter
MIESAVWELLTFILNAFVFLLIGLELPLIVEGLRPDVMLYVRDAAIICALVIGIRMAWVYADRALPSIVGRDRGGRLSWPSTTIVGWAGMRGIVSLAAALAIPYDFALSDDHPIRAEVIFYTLCVAFVTVVGQGLTLAPLVRFLGVAESSASQREEAKIRIRALGEGMRRLRELEESCDDPVDLEIAGRVLLEYEQRIAQLQGRVDNETEIETDELRSDRLIQSEALEAERHAVARMRANGEIPDAIYNAIQYDLDLAALKLGKA